MPRVPAYRHPRVHFLTGKGLRPAPEAPIMRAPPLPPRMARPPKRIGPPPAPYSYTGPRRGQFATPCPTCGAAAGEPCAMPRKGNRAHLERLR